MSPALRCSQSQSRFTGRGPDPALSGRLGRGRRSRRSRVVGFAAIVGARRHARTRRHWIGSSLRVDPQSVRRLARSGRPAHAGATVSLASSTTSRSRLGSRLLGLPVAGAGAQVAASSSGARVASAGLSSARRLGRRLEPQPASGLRRPGSVGASSVAPRSAPLDRLGAVLGAQPRPRRLVIDSAPCGPDPLHLGEDLRGADHPGEPAGVRRHGDRQPVRRGQRGVQRGPQRVRLGDERRAQREDLPGWSGGPSRPAGRRRRPPGSARLDPAASTLADHVDPLQLESAGRQERQRPVTRGPCRRTPRRRRRRAPRAAAAAYPPGPAGRPPAGSPPGRRA